MSGTQELTLKFDIFISHCIYGEFLSTCSMASDFGILVVPIRKCIFYLRRGITVSSATAEILFFGEPSMSLSEYTR